MAVLLAIPFLIRAFSGPSTEQNVINDVVSQLTEITTKNLQQCMDTVNFSQSVSLVCNVPEEVSIAFLNSTSCQACGLQQSSNPGIDCDQFCRACIQTGFNQSATLVLSQSCKLDSLASANIKNSINDDIDQAVTNKKGIFGQLADFVPNIKDILGLPTHQVNVVNMRTDLKNLISNSNVQTLLNAVDISQSVTVVSSGGSSQGGVTQTLLFYSTSSQIASNLQSAGVVSAVALTGVQNNTTTTGTVIAGDQLYLYIGVAGGVVALLLIIFFVYRAARKKPPQLKPKAVVIT
jgi:hypothetical protein